MLGLIAGRGRLPADIARAARRRGLRVAAIAFHGDTDPGLEAEVDHITWIHVGELERLLGALHAAKARDVVMAGKILKTTLYGDLASLRPDARAIALIAGLHDRSDDAILGAIADTLAAEGLVLRPQAELVPELCAETGVLGAVVPGETQRRDAAFGWRIAKALGEVDVGQTVVVRDRAVMALEAIEGTDEAILRGASLGGAGVTVVKVAKPRQDPRFDLPAIGPDTLAVLVQAKAAALAVEAGRTLVVDRERVVEIADANGIALLGLSPDAEDGGA
ncbi:MAG: UDP-2,3-diacylglucosamine diphosphatase LpxI [Deltaproteobacteria bacterium]|nr:UDP-2,3-diacylglucosamine diphosphatase LpxI [Deltaproteobacteria bacterium]